MTKDKKTADSSSADSNSANSSSADSSSADSSSADSKGKDDVKDDVIVKDDAVAKSDAVAEDIQVARQLVVHAQYIKDMSFENPNAPKVHIASKGQPDVEISINVGVKKIDDDRFEILLNLSAKAKAKDKDKDAALFLVDLTYAGIVSAPNATKSELNPLIMIEAPRLLFPFARAIISDITRDGGFMPLNIQPVDFVALYQHSQARQQQAQANKPH